MCAAPAGPSFRVKTHTRLADFETPLSAYWKLAHDETLSFLFESVTGGEQVARYSFIGVRPRGVFRARDTQSTFITPEGTQTLPDLPDPLMHLRQFLPRIQAAAAAGLPKLCGGAVGFLTYDYVRRVERLPDANPDELGLDDTCFLICDTVVVFDHARRSILLVSLIDESDPQAEARAQAEVERIEARLQGPLPSIPEGTFPVHPVAANTDQATFEAGVERIIEYIRAGDGVQMVPSVRFSTPVDAHPLTVYRALRSLNPSPYMFLFRGPGVDVVGASPELLVGLTAGQARVRPIAGTRPRGATAEDDVALGENLLADEKERAEHIMLVDLGRNDLGRVCQYGSVQVKELMVIERYSHVMHIVSDVVGTLPPDLDGIDLVRATFPAGTLSGAPKIRAMEIIDEIEPVRRGLYGGAIGYFSASGDVDLAIAIRSIVLKNGVGYVQAGAGIVYDSVPSKEWAECHQKAGAALQAIAMAQRGL